MIESQKEISISCLSKIKSFIKIHPYIFYGIIAGVTAVTVATVATCVVLTKEPKKEEINDITLTEKVEEEPKKEEINDITLTEKVEEEPKKEEINDITFTEKVEEEPKKEEINDITFTEKVEEEPKIFPLEENSKQEVMDIYENRGISDQSTLQVFCDYLNEKGSNLKEDQKVYLAYYWVTYNIVYDYEGREKGTVDTAPPLVFQKRKTICTGYSLLFMTLLSCMNYTESKIKSIAGYSKGDSYSPIKPAENNHEWNAVEINGKWCLIDTTWDSSSNDEYYLCTPPKCFVRDHLPFNNEKLQFLENPITLEQFNNIAYTSSGFCNYDAEIIEDKSVQNICGQGKVTVKFNNINEDDTFMVGSVIGYDCPESYYNPIENGYEINIYVNEEGYSRISFFVNYDIVGDIVFNCSEAPTEKVYFPIMTGHYLNSDAKLISPMQKYLTKGQKYTFEIKTNDFEELILKIGDEYIAMTKSGNTFKEENVYIHADSIVIKATGKQSLVEFEGVGENVGYPRYSTQNIPIKVRLLQPLTDTLQRGETYTFEVRCDSIETFKLKFNTGEVEMDRNNNIYSKTFTIDSELAGPEFYIAYKKYFSDGTPYNFMLYIYNLQ